VIPFATSEGQAASGDDAASAPAGSQPSISLVLFAAAREAAGTSREEVRGGDVGEVLEAACARHGGEFAAVLERSRVWVNGEPASSDHPLSEGDEVAVLPPVSGGSGGWTQ
jgi:MoaD family protein